MLLKNCHCFSQQFPELKWQKSFGGTNEDYAYFIEKTNQGGYIACGTTNSNNGDLTTNYGQYDGLIIKLNSAGNKEWQKSLGGSQIDNFTCIRQTSDNGYVAIGGSSSNDGDIIGNHGQSDTWIVKLKPTGELQWSKSFGGSMAEYGLSIQQTFDKGFIGGSESYSNDGDVLGNHGNNDFWILKLDTSGNIEWQKMLEGSNNDYLKYIEQTSNSGFIAVGYTFSNDGDVSGAHNSTGVNADCWIIKLDKRGNLQWQKTLEGSYGDIAYSVEETFDHGYIIAGSSASTNGDITINYGGSDCWIIKLTNAGSISWQKTYGGNLSDVGRFIRQTSDSSYIVAGYSKSNNGNVSFNHGGNDIWIFKIDTSGNLQWEKSFGGSNDEICTTILQNTNGEFVYAGYSASNNGDISGNHGGNDFCLMKLTTAVTICSGVDSNVFIANSYNSSNVYQWQMDSGTGFTNISNNTYYSGTTADTLLIINVSTSWYGYKYRCQITNSGNIFFTDPFILKFGVKWTGTQSNEWNNPANWSCSNIPDENTDVIIPTGLINYPVLTFNTTIKSLDVSSGAYITVSDGITLLITGL